MFELGDGTLGDVEAAGELGLAHRLAVAQFEESELLEGLGAPRC